MVSVTLCELLFHKTEALSWEYYLTCSSGFRLGSGFSHIGMPNFLQEVSGQCNGELKEIDARPSDSIALALRTDAPIFVAKSILSKNCVEMTKVEELDALSEEELVSKMFVDKLSAKPKEEEE